jgi:threonine aldolase
VQGSDRGERLTFLRCLVTRMRDGPDAEPDADLEPDPDANPFFVQITNPDLDHDAARGVVREQAAGCDPAWERLYRIIYD